MVKILNDDGKEFSFQIGRQADKTKTDCKHWGQVKYKFLTVPGCELKYQYWCRFNCMNCKDYEKK